MNSISFKHLPFEIGEKLSINSTENSLNEFNITVTSTFGFDQDSLYAKLSDQLLALEKQTKVQVDVLSMVEENLTLLYNTNFYEDCYYRVNKLKYLYQADQLLSQLENTKGMIQDVEKVLKLIKQKLAQSSICPLKSMLEVRYQELKNQVQIASQNHENNQVTISTIDNFNNFKNEADLHHYLIKYSDKKYINLGKDGREFINKDIFTKLSTFENKEDLLRAVGKKVQELQSHLSNIQNVKELSDLQLNLNKLSVLELENQPIVIQEIVLSYIQQRNIPFTTIGQIKKLIEDTIKAVKIDGVQNQFIKTEAEESDIINNVYSIIATSPSLQTDTIQFLEEQR